MKKEKGFNEISMLQYQILRYQAAGNGSMCQSLNAKVRKLMTEVSQCVTRN